MLPVLVDTLVEPSRGIRSAGKWRRLSNAAEHTIACAVGAIAKTMAAAAAVQVHGMAVLRSPPAMTEAEWRLTTPGTCTKIP
eukprot:6202914-Pleurochrysis_carterae.AAC.5